MALSVPTEDSPRPGTPPGTSSSSTMPPATRARAPVARRSSTARVLGRWVLLLFLVAAVLAGYLAVKWINRSIAEVAHVKRGTAVSAVYGTVRIEYLYQEAIKAENAGYIDLGKDIYSGISSVGIKIAKDQILGTIRDEPTQRALTQAKNDLAVALAHQSLGPVSADALRSAQDRLSRLQRAGSTVAEGDRIAAANTVAQLQAAVQNERTDLQKAVDTAQNIVKAQQDQLHKAEIRSPVDGYLVAAPPVDHELVLLNSVVFTIASKELYVSGQVNEEDVGDLREGMTAEMKLYAYGNREFTAKVQSVLPNADTTDQRYTVTLEMDDPPDNLRAGETGEMNIIVGKHDGALIIPSSSLIGPDKVFIVRDGVVEPRIVKTGYKNPETVQVLDGLKEGDEVITSDQDTFRVGDRVRSVFRDSVKKKEKKQ